MHDAAAGAQNSAAARTGVDLLQAIDTAAGQRAPQNARKGGCSGTKGSSPGPGAHGGPAESLVKQGRLQGDATPCVDE